MLARSICRRGLELSSLAGKKIDTSKVPKLKEEDLEEKFIKGWGPGGQAVNKTTSAVFLKHLPTGVWLKCQESRSLDQNRKIARKQLITKLDNEINGEESVENRRKAEASRKRELKKEKTRLKYQLKKEQKEIEIEEKAKENNSAEIDKQDNSDQEKDEVIANSKLSEGPGLQDGR